MALTAFAVAASEALQASSRPLNQSIHEVGIEDEPACEKLFFVSGHVQFPPLETRHRCIVEASESFF